MVNIAHSDRTDDEVPAVFDVDDKIAPSFTSRGACGGLAVGEENHEAGLNGLRHVGSPSASCRDRPGAVRIW